MKLYLSIITIAAIILASVNAALSAYLDVNAALVALFCFLSVIACIAIDAVVAIIVRAFPQKNYAPTKWIFKERRGECSFYEKLGIKKWKDKIPETGKLLVKFGKSKIEQHNNPEYLYRFLTELGYAEIMHWISTIAGFLVIFILPLKFALFIGIPVATVNFLLQIPPALVQRYNRPRILRIYNRLLQKQNFRHSQANEQITINKTEI